MYRHFFILLFVVFLPFGCGRPAERTMRVTPRSSKDMLRETVQQIGETGVIDSAVDLAHEFSEKLVAENADYQGIVELVEALASARGPKAVSRQANKILAMLE